MSIKVAVRLRPFNKRELDMQSSNVVEMEGQKTILTQLESGKKREFNFDYSLWSFDGFDVQPNGYCAATGEKYMDQERVFDRLGS